jgi:Flp pilus assembly pilin Flp
MQILKNITQSQDGATAIEYALLAGLIGVFCVGAFSFFGNELGDSFAASGGSVDQAMDRAIEGARSNR